MVPQQIVTHKLCFKKVNPKDSETFVHISVDFLDFNFSNQPSENSYYYSS